MVLVLMLLFGIFGLVVLPILLLAAAGSAQEIATLADGTSIRIRRR